LKMGNRPISAVRSIQNLLWSNHKGEYRSLPQRLLYFVRKREISPLAGNDQCEMAETIAE
jgi:hypothetical protein